MALTTTWTDEDVAYVVDQDAPGRPLTEGATADGWLLAEKTARTPVLPVKGPVEIVTQEGDYELPEGWEGYVAVDQAGYPYPIALAEFQKTYKVVYP